MTTPDSQRVVPVELLPCPFCNAEPAYFSGTDIQYGHGESSDYAGVRCSVCRVEISFCNYAGYQLTERMALAAEKWNRRAASPPVAPPAAAQEGVRVVCWRYIRPDGSPWKWNDGAPTTAEYENAGDETIELAYSRPPAQTQGAAKPAAWLHQVVGDDGEPDQALSFAPDNFPLQGVVGYRSLSHKPLYLHPAVISEPTDVALNVNHIDCHKAADAFWAYWQSNGETHKHGYYESTWGAINAALRTVGVVPYEWGHAAIDAAREG